MAERFPLGIATGAAFCNRESERRHLADNLRGGRHTLLMAPRRYGKTSLTLEVLDRLEDRPRTQVRWTGCDFLVAHDADSVRDALLAAVGRLAALFVPVHRRAVAGLSRFFQQLRPEITLTERGPRVRFIPSGSGPESIVAALTGLDALAGQEGVRAVLVMDEFQQIGTLRHCRPLEAAIRHAAERTAHSTYVFSGSNRHMLAAMFGDAGRPLYRLCERLPLARIARAAYIPFLLAAARETWRRELEPAALDAILAHTRRHPYYVNLLCARLWREPEPPQEDDATAHWDAYVRQEARWLAHEVAELSPNQRAVLAALAQEPTAHPQSKGFLARTRLAGASNAQAVSVLTERDLVYRDEHQRLRVLDPALERYLQHLGE